jgi:hypothetical protein
MYAKQPGACARTSPGGAEVDDSIRQRPETIRQALIESELSAVIGDLPHERSSIHTGQRNGHRPGGVQASTAGDLGAANH